MELISHSISTYQKNQNLAEWVQQTSDIASVKTNENNIKEDNDSSVSLSNQNKVFEWVAHTLPVNNTNSANLSRASQVLYEYSVLTIEDIRMLNKLSVEKADKPLLESVDDEINNSKSFKENKTLEHLKQVFLTLAAAS